MSEEAPRPAIPTNVTAIGILHLFGAFQNLLLAFSWVLGGLNIVVATFGIGLPVCCIPFLLGSIAMAELYSGIKHLSQNQAGLRAPTLVASLEVSTLLCCSPISGIIGIVVLVITRQPDMVAWYAQKQLEGSRGP